MVNKANISKTKKVAMKAAAIPGIGLPTGAIWFCSDACASAMLFVIVFVVTGKQSRKTNSLCKVIKNAIVNEVVRNGIHWFDKD